VSELRAGLLGCGTMGRTHAESLKQVEDMSMVAFCDRLPERAESFLDEFGGAYATDDPARLLADKSLDAIYVCTHHDTHAQLCVEALEASKAVMVEKPLALTVEDCTRIARAVQRTKGMLMTAFMMRYEQLILKARELIPHPIMVVVQMMDNRWPDNHWANNPEEGGGNVISQGCHSCDILRFISAGEPVQVYATGGNYYQATGVVDNICAVFRLTNGCACSWIQGDAACPPVTSKFFIQLFSENKSVTLDRWLTRLTYQETGQEPQQFESERSGYVEENRAFARAIRTGSPAPVDHKDGLMATLMPLQAMASLRSRNPEPVLPLFEAIVQAP